MHYLYKITNKINGKCYIGQAKNYKSRMRYHINGYGKSKNSLISKAMLKYGAYNFDFIILGTFSDEDIDFAEISAIKIFEAKAPTGYNIAEGGYYNKVMSKETREKISKANTGHPAYPNQQKAASMCNKGKKLSQEAKDRIGRSKTGVVPSAETRAKISKANKGNYKHTEETKRRFSEARKGVPRSKATVNKWLATKLEKGIIKKLRNGQLNLFPTLDNISLQKPNISL